MFLKLLILIIAHLIRLAFLRIPILWKAVR